MATMKVIRNAAGDVINIGDWNYQIYVDDDGANVITNPMPVGATEANEDVGTRFDGGLEATSP